MKTKGSLVKISLQMLPTLHHPPLEHPMSYQLLSYEHFKGSRTALTNRMFCNNGNVLFCAVQYGSH